MPKERGVFIFKVKLQGQVILGLLTETMEQLQPVEMVVTVYPSPRHDIPEGLELPTTAVLEGAHQLYFFFIITYSKKI